MSKNYYRPIIIKSPKGSTRSYKLAGGWAFFENVEVIQRNGKPKIIKAENLPKKVLHNLTIKRQSLFNLSFSSPHVMGILNVTPDSFSDGGKYSELECAFEEFTKMMNYGAAIIDIGGESTRPGADPITVSEEISRISPILEKIRSSGIDLPISVDTRKSEVWDVSKQLGADMLNDISSLSYDKEMKTSYNGGLLPENGYKDSITLIDGDTCFESVLGSAMLIKKKDFINIGKFNENLFLFYSDDDLCRKFRISNKSIVQIFSAKAYHLHGLSKVKNIFKRIYLKEFNMTFDELFYHSMIVKNDDKFYKLKKKILNYYIKILTNFLILNFKKVTFYFARILAFYKFKAIR